MCATDSEREEVGGRKKGDEEGNGEEGEKRKTDGTVGRDRVVKGGLVKM